MGRIADALAVLTGRAKAVPGEVFSGDAASDAGGLLGAIMPSGRPPTRGAKELAIAYKRSPAVRAVVGKIAEATSNLDWRLYAVKSKSTGKALRLRSAQFGSPSMRRKLVDAARADGTLKEIEEHPMLEFLDVGNPAIPGLLCRRFSQVVIEMQGEVFWILDRTVAGQPAQYWPIPSNWVLETPSVLRPVFRVQFGGWSWEIPETEVVWVRDLDPENPYARGAGVGLALGDEIDTDEYAAKLTKAWFYNDAVPSGLVGIEGARQDQIDQAKAKWEDENRGFWKKFRLHFHSGKLNFVSLSSSFKDQQLVELRKDERDFIRQTWGAPPEIFGITESSNRATIDAADYLMARYITVPRAEFWRAYMQTRLAPEWDERLIIDYVSPVQEDREHAREVFMVAPWAFTKDEFRSLAGRPPVTDGTGDLSPPMPPDPVAMAEIAAETKPKPGDDKKALKGSHVTEGAIDQILEQLRPDALTAELEPLFLEKIQEWAKDVLGDLGQSARFDLLNPKIAEHLRQFAGDRIEGIVDATTRDALRSVLIEVVRAGGSIDDLVKAIDEVFDYADDVRAATIARTEVLRSSNWASTEAFRISGVVDEREWVATPDERTRESHLAMDGQVVGINEKFVAPTGAEADHPGAFGIADEDIQCRCTTAAVIADPDKAGVSKAVDRVAAWKRWDAVASPWEADAEAAVKRGLGVQRREVIAGLRALAG